ncbi:MAG: response regulator [Bacteroidetes bacterium]|nr:response regulator [Bacteroidota bacterium]
MLLLIISSIASYTSIQNLLDNSRLVNHTNTVIKNTEELISTLKDAETGQRGFLLTGNDLFLEPYNGAYQRSLDIVRTLKGLTADNPDQQASIERMQSLIEKRISLLQRLVDEKRQKIPLNEQDLLAGKQTMDEARSIIKTMEDREQQLLNSRTNTLNRFATYTPALIIVTAILSLAITIIFFSRVNADFEKRTKLQKELEEKDESISRRIVLIQDIADKISAGNYSIRVSDAGKDTLGSLAGSLNKMAQSLDYSFSLLSDKEWLQAGIAGLNEKMLGDKTTETIAQNILEYVTHYSQSQVGALYLMNGSNGLTLTGSVAFDHQGQRQHILLGEGLVGQCAATGKEMILTDIDPEDISITYAAGALRPKAIVAIPIIFERSVKGVIELATTRLYNQNDHAFFGAISHSTGIVINTAQSRQRLQELLEETQSQSEELQAQHSELENINEELEIQAQKLQASEEELKVQQEELQQANQELEERARILEDKNQLIVERNIEIQTKAEELAVSTRYKSEFLANMSHELRTPLNSILLLSRLLSENNDKNLSDEQIEYAQVIQSSGQGLLSLIDEILDLSKIESGKMDLEYHSVAVSEMTGDMNALFRPIASEKNLDFEITVAPDVPSRIETDKMRVEQVLKNLLSNALKFTAKGSVKMHVSRSSSNAGHVLFTVTDTGIGIPQDKQQLIFEAFRQADGSTRRKYGGTGLGLSISRELTRLLGAEIQLSSESGQGSTFVFSLPVARPAVIQPGDEAPVAETPDRPTEPAATKTSRRYISEVIPEAIPDDRNDIDEQDKVILIIEDDTSFAKALLDFTRKKQYKGIVAVRGDEGLDLAIRFRPTGILLDIQLPVKDGWEVMEDLKSNPDTRHIPVHIMSSHELKNKSLTSGAIDFINKPVAFEKMQEIFQKIEYVLNHHPKKVLIVEENNKHAKALAYFLETSGVNAEIRTNVPGSIESLRKKDVDCVILDMGIPNQQSYEMLEQVKKTHGLENLPIIIFTGKSLSKTEELRIRQYADSIVIKTAHSYKRIQDEVSLFLHLVEENKRTDKNGSPHKKLGALTEVLKGKTALIVDDDVRNIFSLSKALESFKMKIVSAIDGKEALTQLEQNPGVNIVLMDMMMPEMDGYETTRRIRQNRRFKNLPVIAVTAKAMTGDREKCIEAGASDYITKPVDIDQLLSLLRVWLYDRSL